MDKKIVPVRGARGLLSHAEFQKLAKVPAEAEWFANIDNKNTRRPYRIDLQDFMLFVGMRRVEEFRQVTRAHVIAWRRSLKSRNLSGDTIRRKLVALSSFCGTSTVSPDAHASQEEM